MRNPPLDPVIELGWIWSLRKTTTTTTTVTTKQLTNLLVKLNYVRDEASVVIFLKFGKAT